METQIEYSPKAMVRIRKGQGRSLKAGGAWIYDNEIESVNGAFENGDMVTVEDFDGYPLGTGFINTKSKLTVRMMSRRKDTVIDSDFLEMRVRSASTSPTTAGSTSCSSRALREDVASSGLMLSIRDSSRVICAARSR